MSVNGVNMLKFCLVKFSNLCNWIFICRGEACLARLLDVVTKRARQARPLRNILIQAIAQVKIFSLTALVCFGFFGYNAKKAREMEWIS